MKGLTFCSVILQFIMMHFIFGWANAGPIIVSPTAAPFAITEDFESFPLESEIVGILNLSGFSMAEAFAGQTVGTLTKPGFGGGIFETVSGIPTGPLSLLNPANGDGLYTRGVSGVGKAIAGLADGTNDDDIGEGLISLLFNQDLSAFGLKIATGVTDPTSTVTINFFTRGGSLLDTILLSNTGNAEFTFTSSGAGIAGVTISNTDPFGIGIDDVRLGTPIPEPSTLVLLSSALCGLVILRRKLVQK